MKNTDIVKIRHILENIVTITNAKPHVVSDKVIGELATKALTLLPCKTCGDDMEVRLKYTETLGRDFWHMEPCPDCQS